MSLMSFCRSTLLAVSGMSFAPVVQADLRVAPLTKFRHAPPEADRDLQFRIAPQWTLSVKKTFPNFGPSHFQDAFLKYDASLGTLEISYTDQMYEWLQPNSTVNTTVILHANGTAEERVGDECGNEHSDNMVVFKALAPLFFRFVAGEAKRDEALLQQGRLCNGHPTWEAWKLQLDGVGNISVCMEKDVPRRLYYSADPYYVGPSNKPWVTDGVLHVVGPAQLGPPTFKATGCTAEMWPLTRSCPGEGVKTMTVFRFFNFDGEGAKAADVDTSDLPGTVFDLFNGYVTRKYLKALNVTVDSRFGPYRDCNWNGTANHCEAPLEGLGRLVTRSTPFQAYGPHWGQCSDNELTGSWLTFPSEGHCMGDDAVGTDGCTWRVLSAKVIEMECIRSKLTDLMKQERYHAPYPGLQKAILDGMATCPSVDLRSQDTLVSLK